MFPASGAGEARWAKDSVLARLRLARRPKDGCDIEFLPGSFRPLSRESVSRAKCPVRNSGRSVLLAITSSLAQHAHRASACLRQLGFASADIPAPLRGTGARRSFRSPQEVTAP